VSSVLVIDDEGPIRDLLRAVLEQGGHQVREAREGKEGVRLLREQPADVVFCDVFMPVQEGLETIQQLQMEMPDVKVVAMSGGSRHGFQSPLDCAVMLGAAAVLRKPFPVEEVFAVVENLTGDSKQLTPGRR
jgi:CheY-like chemotaxis protein